MLQWSLFVAIAITIPNQVPCVGSLIVKDANDDPIVTLDGGQLRGKVVSTLAGQCDSFIGVPFAAPPIADLRWKKPQSPSSWSGIREAKQFAPQCIQTGSNGTDPKTDSEDCLYLNIFVPKLSDKSNTSLPVMVYIHGGSFAFGSSVEFGQEGPCENLASRGVIVVIIQYRLFLYGFFSTGDNAALGNYGIWDQIEALKWVNGNIAKFGGDPNKVTVFGESAGGGSVSYITYIPAAKDYFQQSIAQSGSVFCSWSGPNEKSAATTRKLAKAANCTDLDTSAV